MLHSNPGDYAWGQGGLDAVITQVAEQGLCVHVTWSVALCKQADHWVFLSHSYWVSLRTQVLLLLRKRKFPPSPLLSSLRNTLVSLSSLFPFLWSPCCCFFFWSVRGTVSFQLWFKAFRLSGGHWPTSTSLVWWWIIIPIYGSTRLLKSHYSHPLSLSPCVS